MNKIFTAASKNLKENEKHFQKIFIRYSKHNLTEATLNDDSFANITFTQFVGEGIKRISNKAFGKSYKTITLFSCLSCELIETPFKYNIWTTLNQLTEVKSLELGLNVTEMPSNAFKTINGSESKLGLLRLRLNQNFTIKSNAFNNLKQLNQLYINENYHHKNHLKFEKSAFNFSDFDTSSISMYLYFDNLNLTGDSFAPGSFDGNKRGLDIAFYQSNITYIPESSFKYVLSNNKNTIKLRPGESDFDQSYIDCFDCRNLWLINNQFGKQVMNANCTSDKNKTLFDKEIQDKLKNKCK